MVAALIVAPQTALIRVDRATAQLLRHMLNHATQSAIMHGDLENSCPILTLAV